MQPVLPSGSPAPPSSPTGACLSFFLPGLGHWARGYPLQAIWIFSTGGFLSLCAWGLVSIGGVAAGIFFGMLTLLPWWCLQTYGAFVSKPLSQIDTLKLVWHRGHDIRFLGGLFLLTAFTDLYIILVNPDYGLTVFCSKPRGGWGILAKAQSPILHVAIGFGFLRLARWSLFVYLAYASFGLLNATANYACFGFGRIRTVFFLSLLGFSAYVLWRRNCFSHDSPQKDSSNGL